MPLTTEEKQELITEIGKGLAANFADALKPVTEQITALQTNHQQLAETLTANSRAEEKTMRDAVQAVHGELVANALSGPALKEMFSKLGTAAPLGTNSATQPGQTGAPDPSTYFPA